MQALCKHSTKIRVYKSRKNLAARVPPTQRRGSNKPRCLLIDNQTIRRKKSREAWVLQIRQAPGRELRCPGSETAEKNEVVIF